MITDQESFDFEMGKLKGKNQLCLEIWGRLQPYLKPLQTSCGHSNSYASNGMLIPSQNMNISYKKIVQLQFSNGRSYENSCLNLITSVEIIQLKSFAPSFQRVSNIFNVVFPT